MIIKKDSASRFRLTKPKTRTFTARVQPPRPPDESQTVPAGRRRLVPAT